MAPAVGTFSDLVDIVIATEAYNSLEQRQSLSASVVQLTPSTVFQSDQGTTVGGLRNLKSGDKNLLPGNADAGEPSRRATKVRNSEAEFCLQQKIPEFHVAVNHVCRMQKM